MSTRVDFRNVMDTRKELEDHIEKGSSEKFSDPEKELKILQDCCDHPSLHRMFGYCGICGKKVNF